MHLQFKTKVRLQQNWLLRSVVFKLMIWGHFLDTRSIRAFLVLFGRFQSCAYICLLPCNFPSAVFCCSFLIVLLFYTRLETMLSSNFSTWNFWPSPVKARLQNTQDCTHLHFGQYTSLTQSGYQICWHDNPNACLYSILWILLYLPFIQMTVEVLVCMRVYRRWHERKGFEMGKSLSCYALSRKQHTIGMPIKPIGFHATRHWFKCVEFWS